MPRKGSRGEDINAWPIVAERFKTRLCNTWEQGLKCQYMSRCMFAHGPQELRTAEQNTADGLVTPCAVRTFQRDRARAIRDGRIPAPPDFGPDPALAADGFQAAAGAPQGAVHPGLPPGAVPMLPPGYPPAFMQPGMPIPVQYVPVDANGHPIHAQAAAQAQAHAHGQMMYAMGGHPYPVTVLPAGALPPGAIPVPPPPGLPPHPFSTDATPPPDGSEASPADGAALLQGSFMDSTTRSPPGPAAEPTPEAAAATDEDLQRVVDGIMDIGLDDDV